MDRIEMFDQMLKESSRDENWSTSKTAHIAHHELAKAAYKKVNQDA